MTEEHVFIMVFWQFARRSSGNDNFLWIQKAVLAYCHICFYTLFFSKNTPHFNHMDASTEIFLERLNYT